MNVFLIPGTSLPGETLGIPTDYAGTTREFFTIGAYEAVLQPIIPSAPTVNNPHTTSLDVAVNANGNPSANQFAIQDSDNSLYIQADGTRAATAVWQTAAVWGTKTVTGLTLGVTYTFKVKARNSNLVETAFGPSAAATTGEKPTVTTQAVTAIFGTTATGNGNSTSLGYPLPTAYGVCWGASADPDITLSTKTNEGAASATGAFTSSITGLAQGTTYHLRAYATNATGTGYGSDVTFTTGKLIFVDLSKTSGANNGTSWADAYTSFQSALEAALPNDEIWVAKGIYKPSKDETGNATPTDMRTVCFKMKNKVAIYGGFAGTETAITQRTGYDTGEANETILSGDMLGNDAVTGSGVNFDITNTSDNCDHVIYNKFTFVAPLTDAILDGFTVSGGNSGGFGGGMNNNFASPVVQNCTFRHNRASASGAGIYNNNPSSPVFVNCKIVYNVAAGAPGAGINNSAGTSVVLTNCVISANSLNGPPGGGIWNNGSTTTLNNSIIWGNYATSANEIFGTVTMNNCCYANGPGDVGDPPVTTACISLNPEYVNAGTGDFRIVGISPCADAGDNTKNSLTTDIRGTGFGRKLLKTDATQAGPIDMGAYEYKNGFDPAAHTASLTTTAITGITVNSANSGGETIDDMGETISAKGVVWDIATEPTTALSTKTSETVTSGSEDDGFTSAITGLNLNTKYYVRAYAINSLGTGYGDEKNFWTLANVPGKPTVNAPQLTSLNVAINANSNPAITKFAILETGGNKYVQANGTLGNDSVWQTEALWEVNASNTAKTITGLSENTKYVFKVKAKNGSNAETLFSSSDSLYTLAKVPATPTINAATTTTLNVAVNANANPAITQYAIQESIGSKYVQSDGSLGDNAVWKTETLWEVNATNTAKTVTGLSVNTQNTFKVKARNGNDVETAFSGTASLYTLANVPSAPTVNNPTATSLDVAVNVNGNPEATEFAIQDSVNNLYVKADGTRGATAVWQTVTSWGTTTVTSLSTGVTYYFRVKAKNGVDVETDFSYTTAQNTCSNPTNGGEIDGEQTICYNTEAAGLGSISEASNYGGTLEYQWQSSTQSSGAGFTEIIGTATNTYSPGALTQTSWFRRLARVSCKDNWTGAAESNVIKVTIDPATVSGSISGNDSTIVHTGTGNLTLSGQTGEVLQWEKKLNAGSWEIIPGTALTTYSETPVTVGAWSYRALVQSGVCSSTYTTDYMVEVIPDVPEHFTLSTPGTATAGYASGNFVIALFDQYDNPTYCRANTTFNLSTNSTSSSHSFNPASPLMMTTDTYSSTFTYTDTRVGTFNITASYGSGSAGLSGESLTVTITIILPEPWVHANIGASNGTTEFFPENNAGTFQMTAQGLSMPKSDVMNYVYQPLCGTGTVIARLDDSQNGGWAGVMMRESNAPGSKAVLFKTKLYNPSVIIGYRATTNAKMVNLSQTIPSIHWMKIQRSGNTFQIFTSYNGTVWNRRYTTTVVMPDCIEAGIFTESIQTNRTVTSWFDHAEVVGYLKAGEDEISEIRTDETFEISFYPNPANDQITILAPDNSKNIRVTLINASGSVVETDEFNTMDAIYNLQHIQPGVYLLRFERDGLIVNKRLIVM